MPHGKPDLGAGLNMKDCYNLYLCFHCSSRTLVSSSTSLKVGDAETRRQESQHHWLANVLHSLRVTVYELGMPCPRLSGLWGPPFWLVRPVPNFLSLLQSPYLQTSLSNQCDVGSYCELCMDTALNPMAFPPELQLCLVASTHQRA